MMASVITAPERCGHDLKKNVSASTGEEFPVQDCEMWMEITYAGSRRLSRILAAIILFD